MRVSERKGSIAPRVPCAAPTQGAKAGKGRRGDSALGAGWPGSCNEPFPWNSGGSWEAEWTLSRQLAVDGQGTVGRSWRGYGTEGGHF